MSCVQHKLPCTVPTRLYLSFFQPTLPHHTSRVDVSVVHVHQSFSHCQNTFHTSTDALFFHNQLAVVLAQLRLLPMPILQLQLLYNNSNNNNNIYFCTAIVLNTCNVIKKMNEIKCHMVLID